MSKKKFFFVFIILFIIFKCNYVYAFERNVSVTPIFSDSQRNFDISYFDILVEPGQQQIVSIRVENTSDKEVSISLSVEDAITNNQGLISYTNNNVEKYRLKNKKLSDYIFLSQKNYTLSAYEVKEIPIEINPPEESFDGVILGGIRVIQNELLEYNKEVNSDVYMVNEFAYLIGIQLTEDNVIDQVELFNNGIYLKKNSSDSFLDIVFSNPQNIILNNTSVEIVFYKEKNKKIRFYKENMKIAPDSIFHIELDTNEYGFSPGKYKVKMRINSDEGSWSVVKSFTIYSEDLNQYVERNQKNYNKFSLYKDLGFIFIVILLVIFIRIGAKHLRL